MAPFITYPLSNANYKSAARPNTYAYKIIIRSPNINLLGLHIQELTTQAISVCFENISHYLKLIQVCQTYKHGSEVLRRGFLYSRWSYCLFNVNLFYIKYVLDDSDLLAISVRSTNI